MEGASSLPSEGLMHVGAGTLAPLAIDLMETAIRDGVRSEPHTPPPSGRQTNVFLPSLWSSNTSSASLALSHPGEHSLDGSSVAQRAAALRQLMGSNPSRELSRHHHTRSSSSRTSLFPQPVIVRTYSGSSSRPQSQSRSTTHAEGTSEMNKVKLPPIEEFRFDGILRAIQPQIQESLEEIAEILGRSRMSLADEYGSHLPPQAEVGRVTREQGRWVRLYDTGLPAVEEASSSSERLVAAGETAHSKGGNGSTGSAAYRSLDDIAAKASSRSGESEEEETGRSKRATGKSSLPNASGSSPEGHVPTPGIDITNDSTVCDQDRVPSLLGRSPFDLTVGASRSGQHASSIAAVKLSREAEDHALTLAETTMVLPGHDVEDQAFPALGPRIRKVSILESLGSWLGLRDGSHGPGLDDADVHPHRRGASTAQRSLSDILHGSHTLFAQGKRMNRDL